jgi:hypothetical protein
VICEKLVSYGEGEEEEEEELDDSDNVSYDHCNNNNTKEKICEQKKSAKEANSKQVCNNFQIFPTTVLRLP